MTIYSYSQKSAPKGRFFYAMQLLKIENLPSKTFIFHSYSPVKNE